MLPLDFAAVYTPKEFASFECTSSPSYAAGGCNVATILVCTAGVYNDYSAFYSPPLDLGINPANPVYNSLGALVAPSWTAMFEGPLLAPLAPGQPNVSVATGCLATGFANTTYTSCCDFTFSGTGTCPPPAEASSLQPSYLYGTSGGQDLVDAISTNQSLSCAARSQSQGVKTPFSRVC